MIYFLCFMAGAFAAMVVIQQVEYRNSFRFFADRAETLERKATKE